MGYLIFSVKSCSQVLQGCGTDLLGFLLDSFLSCSDS